MIPITNTELTLILEESHPEYKFLKKKPLEAGKGSDFHYKINILRLSDNKKLFLVATYNSGHGWQDWIRGGDFVIDEKKEELYDCYGELIEKEEHNQTEEEQKPLSELEAAEIEYKKLEDSGLIPDFKDDSWIDLPIDTLLLLAKECHEVLKNNDFSMEQLDPLRLFVYKVAIEHKTNVERLFSELFNKRSKKTSCKRFDQYLKGIKELRSKETVSFVFNGETINLTRTQMKTISDFHIDFDKYSKELKKLKENI